MCRGVGRSGAPREPQQHARPLAPTPDSSNIPLYLGAPQRLQTFRFEDPCPVGCYKQGACTSAPTPTAPGSRPAGTHQVDAHVGKLRQGGAPGKHSGKDASLPRGGLRAPPPRALPPPPHTHSVPTRGAATGSSAPGGVDTAAPRAAGLTWPRRSRRRCPPGGP